MKRIPLSRGLEALVDDEDYDLISRHSWCAIPKRGTHYAMTKMRDANGRTRSVKMHRLILGAKDTEQVDHKDGDGLHNSRANIRICTSRQNHWNKARNVNKRGSKYKGVHPRGNRWEASIRILGKAICLGLFETEIEAAKAYDRAAGAAFGEFARPNLP